MKNWKGTTGEFQVTNEKTGNCFIHPSGLSAAVAMVYTQNEHRYEAQANAKLFADALNTVNKCDLMPSELLKQRDELLKALEILIEAKQPMLNALDHCRDGLDQEHEWRFDQSEQLIKQIKG